MNFETQNLKKLDAETLSGIKSSFSFDREKEQMRDQINMLEAEIDRQSVIIDALVKAIRVIERG